MKKTWITAALLAVATGGYAQNGWLPPVHFPAFQQFCDNSPWQLVQYDDFNGNQLDTSQWITYFSWDGMPGGDNDNTDAARHSGGIEHVDYSWNNVVKDENIVVSGGTCKLLVKHEPARWHCPSCPDTAATRYYTAGMLATPFHRMHGNLPNYFNSGLFEVRLKMPVFKHAHTTLWTWHGSDWNGSDSSGVNEIDMAEAYGLGTSNDYPYGIVNTYNLHAWGPNSHNANNPYNLPDNPGIANVYPNQNWWNVFYGNYHDISAWHTYACAWDTASIKMYLDNAPINTIWKYSTTIGVYGPRGSRSAAAYTINVGSGCIGNRAGNYNITYGYPYNSKHSECDFRITTVYDGGQAAAVPVTTSTTLGQAEIDYVKIWQRHPEQDGHTSMCPDNSYPNVTIDAPSEICGSVPFTLNTPTTGTWSSFDNSILHIGNITASGCEVAKDLGEGFNYGWVSFSYGNGVPGCPTKTVVRDHLFCNQYTGWQVMQPTVYNSYGSTAVHFITDLYYKRDITDPAAPVVTWNVTVDESHDAPGAGAKSYTLQGQYASLSGLGIKSGSPYYIRWEMVVTDASGSHSRSGERNSQTPLLQQSTDPNTWYANAYIDNSDDYDKAVYDAVAARMVSDEEFNDALYMSEMIEKERAIALEPYITTAPPAIMNKKQPESGELPAEASDATAEAASRTKVYPNPVRSTLTIIPASTFSGNQPIHIRVTDLPGRVRKTASVSYHTGDIITLDAGDLPAGNYILELEQGSSRERIKVTRSDR